MPPTFGYLEGLFRGVSSDRQGRGPCLDDKRLLLAFILLQNLSNHRQLVVADELIREVVAELWAALAVQAAVLGSSWFAKRTGTDHSARLGRTRAAEAVCCWFGRLVSADADVLGDYELEDAQEAKLHLMLEGARGEDVHLEAFLRVVADDHGLEVGAKAREDGRARRPKGEGECGV